MRSLKIGALAAAPLLAAGGLLLARSLSTEPGEAERIRERIAAASEIGWITVSRDGRFIAWANESGDPGLYLSATAAGAPARRLPVEELMPRKPEISPDGRYVAYQAMRPGDSEALSFGIHVHDVERGTSMLLVDAENEGDFIRDLAWSSDGRELTYTRVWREGGAAWQTDIRAAALDGRGDRRLYRVPDQAARAPAWSPDGTRVAFLRYHQLAIMNADGTGVRQLTSLGEGEPAPSAYLPDAPVWSPDGTRLAYSAATGDCHRIRIVDVDSGKAELFGDDDECAMRPAWTPEGDALVYIRLGTSERTLWRRDLAGGQAHPIGFADGMTYQYAFDAAGDLLALGMPSDLPRGIWRIREDGEPQVVASSVDPPLPARWISRPQKVAVSSADGLSIPIQVFPRTCADGDRPGPGVVWLHGGPIADVSARWYQEIQYLTALGATVIAVNYRGSTGNGRAFRDLHGDRDGQVEDTLAAIEYAAGRADIDPESVYLLPISFSAALAYPALERTHRPIRGIIDWTGAPGPIRRTLHALDRPLPPVLFINGTFDRLTETRHRLAEDAAKRGGLVRTVDVPESHIFYLRESRAQALRAVGDFLRETSEFRCR